MEAIEKDWIIKTCLSSGFVVSTKPFRGQESLARFGVAYLTMALLSRGIFDAKIEALEYVAEVGEPTPGPAPFPSMQGARIV